MLYYRQCDALCRSGSLVPSTSANSQTVGIRWRSSPRSRPDRSTVHMALNAFLCSHTNTTLRYGQADLAKSSTRWPRPRYCATQCLLREDTAEPKIINAGEHWFDRASFRRQRISDEGRKFTYRKKLNSGTTCCTALKSRISDPKSGSRL